MVQENCTHCFMEVSSHAAHQNRIAGIDFSGAIFTNLTMIILIITRHLITICRQEEIF
jgi:UDP-N-acetylmuramyl tripeptide synthase